MTSVLRSHVYDYATHYHGFLLVSRLRATVWRESGPAPDPRSILRSKWEIGDVTLQAVAYAVDAWPSIIASVLSALGELEAPQTLAVDDRQYVIFAAPMPQPPRGPYEAG